MASSFAAYASQYLTRQHKDASDVSSSSQMPTFFSFTTDEGSRVGDASRDRDTVLDDDGDPHLGRSSDRARHAFVDEDDPYLRLDEDEQAMQATYRQGSDSVPLIGRHDLSDEEPQGWLAHQTSMPYRNSPSPPSGSSLESEQRSEHRPHITTVEALPPPTTLHSTLTESLLPRDGCARPADLFSLPDPRRQPYSKRAYKDTIWTKLWVTSVCACFVGSFLILFTISKPSSIPGGGILPYTTLLHTVPLITILTILSALTSYAHILLLRIFVQPVLYATSIFIPASLLLSAVWAFIGSFMWNEDVEPSWGETVGLRLFSLVPLALAFITARRLPSLPQRIRTTSSLLTLATRLLIANPFLLALSPFMLLISLVASIPFLTLTLRLLLFGYFTHPFPRSSAWEWHLQEWAGWAITGTILVWLWSWCVGRGILRTACSGVIGAWYFTPSHMSHPPPMSTYRLHAALFRATSLNLGTIALSSLLLAGVRVITLLVALLRRAPSPLLYWFSLPISLLGNLSTSLSAYALVYTGITGDAFFPSAHRARALTVAVGTANSHWRSAADDPSLSILMITPLTLTLPFALTTYLFVAHTLLSPDYAAAAALLAGSVTALVGVFCVGLVEDTADALYMCYCIDHDVGQMHQKEIFGIFEGRHVQSSPPAIPSPTSADPQFESYSERVSPLAEHLVQSSSFAITGRTDDLEALQSDDEVEGTGEEDSMILPGSDLF